MDASSDSSRFINYPPALKGPSVPYKNETQSIPVFQGIPLAIGATLIHNVGFIQSHFWRGAGFSAVREVKHLSQYSPRYDPTVIPVSVPGSLPQDLPLPTERRKGYGGYYSSTDYHIRYRSGELTPTDVVQTLLPLIRRDTNPLGRHSVAFLESQVERICAAAAASTQRYSNGKPLGPLDGVPVVVKDEVDLQGYKRSLGSKLNFKSGADATSWCVKKWEEAGAIIIGKATMHELGLDTNNNNCNYGTPKNPHNENYYCGGSSGGSAYAVAAGLVPIALGADGGGSIRIPASFCGIWGLKPSHGRISAAPTMSLADTVGVYGPMAASIDDLAIAFRTMAAPAPADQDLASSSFPDPLMDISSQSPRPKNRVIGIFSDWIDRAEPAVRAVFDTALAYYCRQGYRAVDISIPYLPEGQRAHVLTIMSTIASGISPRDIPKLTAPNKVLVSMGMWQIQAQDFLAAQRLRNLLMTHLAYLFEEYPGLLIFTPTTPIPGWRIESDTELSRGLSDGKTSVRNMEYAWLANFTGCPAISCPAGYTRDQNRVPIGVMAMGEWGSEEDLIAFARDGEGILSSEENRPVVADRDLEATTGLGIPCGKGAVWEDIIGHASNRSS